MSDFPDSDDTSPLVENRSSICNSCLQNYFIGQDFVASGDMEPSQIESLATCARIKSMPFDTLSIFTQRLEKLMEEIPNGLPVGMDRVIDLFMVTRQEAIFNPTGVVENDECLYMGPIAWHFSTLLQREAATPQVMEKIGKEIIEIFSTHNTKESVIAAIYTQFGFDDNDDNLQDLMFQHKIDSIFQSPENTTLAKMRLILHYPIFNEHVKRTLSLIDTMYPVLGEKVHRKLLSLPNVHSELPDSILYELNSLLYFSTNEHAKVNLRLNKLSEIIVKFGIRGDDPYVIQIAELIGSLNESDTDNLDTHPGFAEA
ncbi:hypothetical protein KC678_03420 [Candidatus Dojkabacteria bacterium]|uniref:Uncharacterized protein n=1 Tax=Candidatus Dojkabacteria bacterium TaxID=2099670 RepID=A0A955L1S3_9BACT|nr:hypothetical protein [Candidatus Dojkabacteria bacterium]